MAQDVNAFDFVMQNLRGKMEGKKDPVMKRPCASSSVLKRPAAGSNSKPMKSSAANSSKAMKSSTSVMKAKKNAKGRPDIQGLKPLKPPNALKMYPDGCPKCRWKAGCTPSCFRYRGEWP